MPRAVSATNSIKREVKTMKLKLNMLNCNQLRKLAVELGADEKTLYGTSKQALIILIHRLMK